MSRGQSIRDDIKELLSLLKEATRTQVKERIAARIADLQAQLGDQAVPSQPAEQKCSSLPLEKYSFDQTDKVVK